MAENHLQLTSEPHHSLEDERNFDKDLDEAIKLSLQDYREDASNLDQNPKSLYLSFNSNGTYFFSNPKSKSPNDPFDPAQFLDIVIFNFKDLHSSSSSSSSFRPPAQTSQTSPGSPPQGENFEGEHLPKELLSSILETFFGTGQFRTIKEQEIIAWCKQGFVVDPSSRLFWGLLQFSNGCCGVLASIQSLMLRSLIFNHAIYGELSFLLQNKPAEDVLFLLNDLFYNYVALRSPDFPRELLYIVPLVESLCSVLYNVAESSKYYVIFYHNLKETEDPVLSLLFESKYCFRSFTNINSVANYLVQNYRKLAGPLGVISMVLSVIFTRTLPKMHEDMDDPNQPLTGYYGHCSQELVNLFLHGRAVSNVFNGHKVIADESSTTFNLKGISSQNTVGFLTELEAMRLYKVGSFYKSPLVPIWVVSSSNHYTVLFGLDGSGCFLSNSDIIEQNVTEAWSQIDTDDNKYIDSKSLGKLLELLGVNHLLQDAMNNMEIVSDLVLWSNFLAWYKVKMDLNTEVQSEPDKSITLFHYNGKDNKNPLHKISISSPQELSGENLPSSQIDANIVGKASGQSEGIAKIVWTRWPRTSVETSAVPVK